MMGATNTFSSPPKVISTRSFLQGHPPPSSSVLPFSSASGLLSFYVQALTVLFSTCQEAEKPEELRSQQVPDYC